MQDFTIKQGLEVQERQLNQWKKLLKTEVFQALVNECMNANLKATNGNGIVRGVTIDNILHNVISKQF